MPEEQDNKGPSLEDFSKAMREATLQGMKDYDREREEWESAVAQQEETRRKSEEDNAPKTTSFLDRLWG